MTTMNCTVSESITPPRGNYTIGRAAEGSQDRLEREETFAGLPPASIDRFHPKSSSHRPVTTLRLGCTDETIIGRFDVKDRFVRATHTVPQSMVCHDSCVEFFFRPEVDSGYFNFEFNPLGCVHASYITDWRRKGAFFEDYHSLTSAELGMMRTRASMKLPTTDYPSSELAGPLEWSVAFSVELKLIRKFCPTFEPGVSHSTGNFYKCGDRTSHPHWAAWGDVGEQLNFHQPGNFLPLRFGSED